MLDGRHDDIVHVGCIGRIIKLLEIGAACDACCNWSSSKQSTFRHAPRCPKRLDICRVRAPIIPIPHVPEAVVAIPLHIRTNFLEMFVKDFPCMFSRFPQKGAAPSAGVRLIGVVVVCKAGEAFGDRGGNEVRYPVCLDLYHFLEPVW